MTATHPDWIDSWLTRTEAARYLRVSPRTLWAWHHGKVRPCRVSPVPNIPVYQNANGRPLYRRADLDVWLTAHPDGPWRPGKGFNPSDG